LMASLMLVSWAGFRSALGVQRRNSCTPGRVLGPAQLYRHVSGSLSHEGHRNQVGGVNKKKVLVSMRETSVLCLLDRFCPT
jgi:hypothetical protein